MAEADRERGQVGPVFEKSKGHNGVDGEFPLVDEEQANSDEAKDNEAEYGRAGPRVGDTAVLQPQKKHYRAANDGNGSHPINGF